MQHLTSSHATSIIMLGVQLGENCDIEPFVIIGKPARDKKEGEHPTLIGPNATIRSHTVIYAENVIGANFQTGHGAMIREANQIGNNVSIGTGSIVEHHVVMGNGVRLHSHVFVPEYSVLEEGCWLGPNVVVTNARYPQSPNAKHNLLGAYICRGAKIGANVTLLPGIRIGENALIGAGAVVTKDVPAGAVIVGNPGRIIGNISDISDYNIEL